MRNDLISVRPEERLWNDLIPVRPEERLRYDLISVRPEERLWDDLISVRPEERLWDDLISVRPEERLWDDLISVRPERSEAKSKDAGDQGFPWAAEQSSSPSSFAAFPPQTASQPPRPACSSSPSGSVSPMS